MEKLPEIKPEVLKEKEENRGGVLGGLLSKLGGGAAAGGAGGAGAVGGGMGGAGLFGGLLATKAGIVALVLAGTSVAGGLGLVGWKTLGPGADSAASGDASLQVFAPKPPSPAGADASQSEGGKDGSSQSLSMVAQANTTPAPAAPAQPASAESTKVGEKDAVAGSAASAAAKAAAAVGSGAGNNTNVGGNRAGSLLAGAKKGFGALSGIGGAGQGGTSASSGGSTSLPVKAANVGAATGFSAANNANGRGLGIRKAGTKGAFQQGVGIFGQSRGAGNLQSGGGAYFDGGTAGGHISGGNGGVALTGAGAGKGAATAKPSSTPAGKGQDSPFTAPPEASGHNVTPWQKEINMAMMMVAGAALLLMACAWLTKQAYAATPVSTWMTVLAKGLAVVAGLMGLAAMALGGVMMQAPYGQKLQGTMFLVAGGAIAAAASMACVDLFGAGSGKPEMASGNPTVIMTVCGAAAIGATLVAAMGPKKSLDSSQFHSVNGGNLQDKDGHSIDFL